MAIRKDTIAHRLEAVRRAMRARGIGRLVLTSEANVSYLTGFAGSDSWALITGRKSYLLTDSRYTEQAGKECPVCSIVERTGSLAELVGKLASGAAARPAVEDGVSVAAFAAIRRCVGARPRAVGGLVEQIRRTKDRSEIGMIRASAALAADALAQTLAKVRTGMTEGELAGLLDLEMRRRGATTSFETIVAFGANGSRPHHRPGRRKLRANDTILIDFGARLNGYCSDMTRCFAVGKASREWARAFDVVERAQAAAMAAIADGVRVEQVDAAARRVIADSGLPVYGHGTGHGIGLEIHETPFMKPGTDEVLRAGDVVTVEPGVYVPGRMGIRIEDDVLVTADGCRLLTGGCGHRPNRIG